MFIENIYSSKVNLRILKSLIQYSEGLSIMEIANITGLSHKAIYNNILDLKQLDIVNSNFKNFKINYSHLLATNIENFVFLNEIMEENIKINLTKYIHDRLFPFYYFGGYTVTSMFISLIDYDIDLIQIGLLKKESKSALKMLHNLNSINGITVDKFKPGTIMISPYIVDEIPDDLSMDNDVFYTSVERGLIELFTSDKFVSPYGKVLSLIQLMEDDILDLNFLNQLISSFPINPTLLYTIKLVKMKFPNLKLIKISKNRINDDMLSIKLKNQYKTSVKEAYNTITGF